jgi:cell division septal protein FtsQ
MARPARQPAELDDPPKHDPASVAQTYRYHRQRRSARVARDRERRRARWRFWLVAALLLLGSLVLAVTIWDQVQTLFGL